MEYGSSPVDAAQHQTHGLRRVDAQPFAGQLRFRHRPGIESAHAVGERDRRQRPVEPGFGLVELVGVGDALRRLRLRHRTHAGAHQLEAVFQHFGAERGEPVVQGAAGIVRRDRRRQGKQHRAGVETRLHLHQRDARLRVAREDRALHRRRPAPARQQARVDVEAAEPRRIENGLRQDQAIGRHYRQIGLERGEFRLLFR